MMATRRATAGVVALILCDLASDARAALTIDAFDDPAPAIVFTMAPDGQVLLDGPRSGPGVLGARSVMKDGNPFEPGDVIVVGDGALTIASQTAPGNDSIYIPLLDYDWTTLPGGSVSLAGLLGFELTFTYIENHDFPGQDYLDSIFTIRTTAGDLQAVGVHFPDLDAGTRTDFVPFSLFSGMGSLDQATGLHIRFNDPLTSRRLDFTLTRLRAVPEPAAGAVAAVAAIALGLVRRSGAARSA
ncbi:MAG TPA: hypothetical protein PKC18_20130 [Lacipirellulaceae bacterium]|nr:hypothetical protein [Lacipirellulaceae bacterium]